MQKSVILTTVMILLLTVFSSSAQDMTGIKQMNDDDKPYLLNYQDLEDSFGRIVLTNEHVVLQRLVVPAGEWEGIHSHPGNQLYVHIKGGVWSGKLADEFEYENSPSAAGSVGWMDAIPYSDGHNSGNTGDAWIDLIYVNLKSDRQFMPEREHAAQSYPNIAMDVVFENDRLIAQRGEIAPGQWTGAHSRPGNQIYILVTGGTLSERRGGGEETSSMLLEDGSPGWLDAAPLSEAYEFGNTGESTIDMVLITIK